MFNISRFKNPASATHHHHCHCPAALWCNRLSRGFPQPLQTISAQDATSQWEDDTLSVTDGMHVSWPGLLKTSFWFDFQTPTVCLTCQALHIGLWLLDGFAFNTSVYFNQIMMLWKNVCGLVVLQDILSYFMVTE